MRILLLFCLCAHVIAGCVSSEVTECANGIVCPETTVCDLENATCIDPRVPLIVNDLLLSDVGCGAIAQAPLVLSNLGKSPIAFSASTTSAIISIDPASATVAPGSTLTVIVAVDATAAPSTGTIQDTILFETETETVPVRVSAELVGAMIRTSADIVDFGLASTVVPPTSPRQFTIHNDGNVATDATLVAPASPFGISEVGPFPIEAGGSRTVDVSFASNTASSYNDVIGTTFSGIVCGTPPESVALSGLVVTNAAMLIDTTTVNFGQTGCSVGAMTQNLTFTNASVVDEQLSFAITGLASNLYSPIAPVLLPAMGSLSVSVVRDPIGIPVNPGSFAATLTVTASQSSEVIDIQLSHAIVAPYFSVTPAELSIQYQPPGLSTTQVSLTNTGNEGVSVNVTQKQILLKKIDGITSLMPTQANLSPMSMASFDLKIEAAKTGVDDAVFDFKSPSSCNVPQQLTVAIKPPQ